MSPEEIRGSVAHPSVLQFLEGLVDQYAVVAGDLLEVAPQTWAIHGSVPGDGEVLMAEFERAEVARAVLASLKPNLPALRPASRPMDSR